MTSRRRTPDRLEALHRIALALSSALAVPHVFRVLSEAMVEGIPRAGEATISIWDVAGDRLVDVAAVGPAGHWDLAGEEFTSDLADFPATRRLLEAAAGSSQYRMSDPDLAPRDRAELAAWGYRATLEVPLVLDGRAVGLIEVADLRNARRFGREDVRFAEIGASLAATAVRNARVFAELQERVDRDPLTGLLNHGAFAARLAAAFADARRDGTPLSVIVLDLDDFKRVNDVHGHLAGDETLRRAAALLLAAARAGDAAGRIGGDEFALAATAPGPAMTAVAERLRRRLAAAGVQASLGVAALAPADGGPTALLGRADAALLRVKRGRKGAVADAA